jgi:hypothetical protein
MTEPIFMKLAMHIMPLNPISTNNKIKTTWNIIKMITGKRPNNTEVQSLYIKEKLTDNHQQSSIFLMATF